MDAGKLTEAHFNRSTGIYIGNIFPGFRHTENETNKADDIIAS